MKNTTDKKIVEFMETVGIDTAKELLEIAGKLVLTGKIDPLQEFECPYCKHFFKVKSVLPKVKLSFEEHNPLKSK